MKRTIKESELRAMIADVLRESLDEKHFMDYIDSMSNKAKLGLAAAGMAGATYLAGDDGSVTGGHYNDEEKPIVQSYTPNDDIDDETYKPNWNGDFDNYLEFQRKVHGVHESKRTVRLTESQVKQIIRESIKKLAAKKA